MLVRPGVLSLCVLGLLLPSCGEDLSPGQQTTSTASMSESTETSTSDDETGTTTADTDLSSSLPTSTTSATTSTTDTTSNTTTSTEDPSGPCAAALEQNACDTATPTNGSCRWTEMLRFNGAFTMCEAAQRTARCVWLSDDVANECPAGCGTLFPYYHRNDDGSLEIASADFACGEAPAGFSRCEFDASTGVLNVGPEACSCACQGGD